MQAIRFSQVSKPSQFLIRLCQRVNYGSVLNVRVIDGDVSFETVPELCVDIRLDGDVVERPELGIPDFELPAETRHLLARINALKNGVIDKIVVQAGVPAERSCADLFPRYAREPLRLIRALLTGGDYCPGRSQRAQPMGAVSPWARAGPLLNSQLRHRSEPSPRHVSCEYLSRDRAPAIGVREGRPSSL